MENRYTNLHEMTVEALTFLRLVMLGQQHGHGVDRNRVEAARIIVDTFVRLEVEGRKAATLQIPR